MTYTILDCYTDEPAGLGVPPYLGTYPRYIAGSLKDPYYYITIDDLRFYKEYSFDEQKRNLSIEKKSQKTNIKIYNLTKNISDIKKTLEETSALIVILGVHTPGKYLSAVPGTLHEIIPLIQDLKCEKILTGPAVYGTQLYGGKFFEKADLSIFNKVKDFNFSYDEIKDYAILGAGLINQIPDLRIVEIETSHGCQRKKGCSFCTEPIKNKFEFRDKADIVEEMKQFYKIGIRHFRIGKQSCFYAYPKAVELLKETKDTCKDIEVLHIDNVNPVNVINDKDNEKTKAIVKYCTEGNVAAFGIESFDKIVYEENNLNCTAEQAYEATKILNRFGAEKGAKGLPKFLPGINLLFGLKAESKNTHLENMAWLSRILKENLLLRRINIRQVSIFPGTELYNSVGNKFIKKNKRHYWKWRNDIRQKIDYEMLKKVAPIGAVLKDVRMEIYDGNNTFGRQIGTYPLIVGVKRRLELKRFYDLKITGHMLRSIVGEPA